MNSKTYFTVNDIKNIFEKDKDAINILNNDIYKLFKITDNPLSKGKFTYGEYQNWIKINPSFNLKQYDNKFSFL